LSSPLALSADVWLADRIDPRDDRCQSTGFPALDAELAGGGWPRSGLIEILSDAHAGVEWLLLAPWLRSSAVGAAGSVLCLAPPHDPYAPGLRQIGLATDQTLVVRTSKAADTAWAAEQALQIGACRALVWWVSTSSQRAGATMLRRIHLGAVTRGAPVFLVGEANARLRCSPAPTRVLIERRGSMLAITVFKRRGPPMSKPIVVALPLFDGNVQRRWQALTQNETPANTRESPRHALACPLPA
jgi:protein ImuA